MESLDSLFASSQYFSVVMRCQYDSDARTEMGPEWRF